MTEQTPPDWVLIEAAKRSEYENATDPTWMRKDYHRLSPVFRALCDMIAKYEQPPVDRKLLCAREAAIQWCCVPDKEGKEEWIACRAIVLWEQGFGK